MVLFYNEGGKKESSYYLVLFYNEGPFPSVPVITQLLIDPPRVDNM